MNKNGQEGFTLIEIMVVMAIIGILASMVGSSFVSSQQKSRDAKRKSDLSQIGRAVELFMNDHGVYPDSSCSDGAICGCGVSSNSACDAGEEFRDANGNTYMGEVPSDPRAKSGAQYYYWSDGVSYQVYARIENEKDQAVKLDAEENVLTYTDTDCGNTNGCNFGLSSSNISALTGRTLE